MRFLPLALGLLTALVAAPAPALAKKPVHHPVAITETPVSVNDAWIREAPPGALALAAYMLVVNFGKKELQLTKVTSPTFEEVQMHVVETKDGMTKMRAVPGFTLAPAARLVFKPGGNHLMLMKPKKQLKAGDVVPMTLWFGPGGHRSIQVKVLQQGITGDTLQH